MNCLISKIVAKHQDNSTRFNKLNKILNKNRVDIGHNSLLYTWWNSITNVDAVFARLDRIIANPPWINLYGEAQVENLLIVGSDHGPTLLSLDHKHRTGKFPTLNLKRNGYCMTTSVI